MRFIAQPHMQGARIGGRVDGDGAHAKSFGGTSDTAGDLAAIGDEDRAEHEARILEHDGAPPSLVFGEDVSRGEARDSVRRSTGAAGGPQAECGRIGSFRWRRLTHCPRAAAAAFASAAGTNGTGLSCAGGGAAAAGPTAGCGGSGSGQIGSTAACWPGAAG